jgi:hypothetical protein
MNEDGFFDLICNVLEKPDEAYVDTSGSKYLLKRTSQVDMYLNIIVYEGVARTAYLISSKTHSRMRRRKWLRRLC